MIHDLDPRLRLAHDSKSPKQYEDKDDHQDQAQAPAAVVAGSIEWTTAEAAKAPEQQYHQNDE